jgi:hypothetical protein
METQWVLCEAGTKFIIALLFSLLQALKGWKLLIATVSCHQQASTVENSTLCTETNSLRRWWSEARI